MHRMSPKAGINISQDSVERSSRFDGNFNDYFTSDYFISSAAECASGRILKIGQTSDTVMTKLSVYFIEPLCISSKILTVFNYQRHCKHVASYYTKRWLTDV